MLDETLLREAEAFANSQTMAELFKRLKEQARNEWANTTPDATAAREHLYRMHEALEMLEAALRILGTTRSIDAYNSGIAGRGKVE